MTWKEAIQTYAEQANIKERLSNRISILTEIMAQLILKRKKDSLFKLAAELPQMTAGVLDGQNQEESIRELQKTVSELSHDEIVSLLRMYTIFFHLVNSLEQHEIIRINRERARKSNQDNPRAESNRDSVRYCSKNGYSFDETAALFKRSEERRVGKESR